MTIRNFNGIKSLFFDNLTVKQTLFKNTFWLVTAGVINKFLKFVLFVYVARILGATEYGKFTFALALVGLFIIFADLGLSQIITREFAKEKGREKEFPDILSLKILLCLGTLIFILISSFFVTPDPIIQKIIWILALCILIESFFSTIFAFLQARQKMEYQSSASILETLLTVGAGLFILFYFPSAQNLSYSYLFAASITLIFILIFFHFKIQRLSLAWNFSVWRKFLLISWPLALVGVAGTIFNQIDSVMLGYFGQITQTGWYNAAYRVIWVTLIPTGLIAVSFFPVLSKYFKESKEKLQKTWDYYMELIIFLAIPLTIGGIVLAPKIIDFIYGQDYAPAVLAFQILMITAGIVFLNTPLYDLMIVSNQQAKIFWISLSGAIINVILNLTLIPKFSLYGAAVATVITQLLIFFLLVKFTLKFTPIAPFDLRLLLSFIGVALSSLTMCFVISRSQIYHLHILFSILIGAIVYFITIFGLKYLKRNLIYEKK